MAEEVVVQIGVQGAEALTQASGMAARLSNALDAAKKAASKVTATGTWKDLTKHLGAAGSQLKEFNFGELEGALGKVGGPLGSFGQKIAGTADSFLKMQKSLGTGGASAVMATTALAKLGAVAVAAAAAAAIAFAVMAAAAVALVAKLVSVAVSTSDAALKADLLRESMTGSAASATALGDTIGSVASRVPLAASEVSALGDKLWKAGKRGQALEDALLAASYEAAGLGKNPGPDQIARRMANLDVVGMRLKDHIAAIFSGASTKAATSKFERSLSGLTELFGQNNVEGRALQKLMSVIVDPLINGLTALMPLAKSVFRGMIVAALDIAIAAVAARNAILNLIPKSVQEQISALVSSQTVLNAAFTAGRVIVSLALVTFLVLAGVIGAVVAVVVALGAAFYAAASVIANAVVAIGIALSDAMSALGLFSGSGADAADGMISGLVDGIRNGAGAVVDAVRALAAGAVGAIKAALQIASPSRVFADLGEYTGEGYAIGVEEQTATVHSALETMVTPPSIEATASAAPSAPGAAQARSGGIDLSGTTFNFYGVADAESGAALFEDALSRVLHGDAVAAGAA